MCYLYFCTHFKVFLFFYQSLFSLNRWATFKNFMGRQSLKDTKDILERPRKEGGLALPNLMSYSWAANLQKLVYWFQAPETDWCNAEAKSCKQALLATLITSELPLCPSQFSSSPVVSSILTIWIQFRQPFNLSGLSILSPICNNHRFPAAKLDNNFREWNHKGLTTCKDFFPNPGISQLHWLFQHVHYFQIQFLPFPADSPFYSTPPKASVWLSDPMMLLKLENIKYFLKGSTKKFYNTWDPTLTYWPTLTIINASFIVA